MKKLTFLFLIVIIGLTNIWAQTTLQYSIHALLAGKDNPMSYCKYSDPGFGGKEQTWNFSQLIFEKPFTGFVKTSDYTNYQAKFPESNTVLAEFNSLFYLNVSKDKVDQNGYISSDGKSKISYSVPFVKMKFPFSYGDIYSGIIVGTSEESGKLTGNITGSYTVEADGYGKLILPGNTIFEDVLRVKTSKSYDNQIANTTQHVDIVTYRWYNAVHRFPLLVLTEYTTSTGKDQKSVNYQAAYNSDAIRFSNALPAISEQDIALFPNPVISDLNLTFSSPVSGAMNLEIYDSEGRQINFFNQVYAQGFNTVSLNKEITGLKPGSYFLVINTGSSKITKDFTIIK
jgi:hypothetical protein